MRISAALLASCVLVAGGAGVIGVLVVSSDAPAAAAASEAPAATSIQGLDFPTPRETRRNAYESPTRGIGALASAIASQYSYAAGELPPH